MTPTALNNCLILFEFEDLREIVLPGVPWEPKEGFVAKNSKPKISRYCPFKCFICGTEYSGTGKMQKMIFATQIQVHGVHRLISFTYLILKLFQFCA
jgi:hypothetical protein